MHDREKDINAYEDFVNGYECFCTSDDYEYEMHKAVLALLKEDCHNCKLECLLQKYDELKEKYDKLLKEQEAVKPKIDAFGHPYCPKCKILVYEAWEFCPHCGKPISWERPVKK